MCPGGWWQLTGTGSGAFLARLVWLGAARCRFRRSQKGLSQRRVLQVFIMPQSVCVCVFLCVFVCVTVSLVAHCHTVAEPHPVWECPGGGGTHVCAHLARLMYDT